MKRCMRYGSQVLIPLEIWGTANYARFMEIAGRDAYIRRRSNRAGQRLDNAATANAAYADYYSKLEEARLNPRDPSKAVTKKDTPLFLVTNVHPKWVEQKKMWVLTTGSDLDPTTSSSFECLGTAGQLVQDHADGVVNIRGIGVFTPTRRTDDPNVEYDFVPLQ